MSDMKAHPGADTVHAHASRSRFENLPPEIRNRIYKYTLSSDPVILSSWNTDDGPHQPSITRISRSIRSETLPMFYAVSDFNVVGNYSVYRYKNCLRAIGPANARHIRNITIDHADDRYGDIIAIRGAEDNEHGTPVRVKVESYLTYYVEDEGFRSQDCGHKLENLLSKFPMEWLEGKRGGDVSLDHYFEKVEDWLRTIALGLIHAVE